MIRGPRSGDPAKRSRRTVDRSRRLAGFCCSGASAQSRHSRCSKLSRRSLPATRLSEAARARRVGTDLSLVASSPSTCDDSARRLTRRLRLGRAGLQSPPLGRPTERGCQRLDLVPGQAREEAVAPNVPELAICGAHIGSMPGPQRSQTACWLPFPNQARPRQRRPRITRGVRLRLVGATHAPTNE